MKEIYNTVKSVIADELEIEESEISIDSLLEDDLGANSLDLVEIIVELEYKLGITFPDNDIEKINSVCQLIEAVKMELNMRMPSTINKNEFSWIT